MQASRRQAEQEPCERTDDDDGGYRRIRRQMEVELVRVEERVRVGAEPVERDITEVEEPAPADDDVEAEREHHVQHRVEADAAHVAARGQRR